MTTTPRRRPEDDFATQAGVAVRDKLAGVSAGIAAQQATNAAANLSRATANPGPRLTGQGDSAVGRFTAGLTGGTPTLQRAAGAGAPSLATPVAPMANPAAPATATLPTMTVSGGRPNIKGGQPMNLTRSSPVATPAIAPAQPAAAPAAAAPNPVRADGVMVSKDANGNNVYTGTGTVTQAAAAANPAMQAPAMAMVNGRPVSAPNATDLLTTLSGPANATAAGRTPMQLTRDVPAAQIDPVALAGQTVGNQRGQTLQARGDAAEMLNPNSKQAQLLRQAINTATSSELRGYKSSREQIVGQILGQIDTGNRASLSGQGAGNEAFADGAAQAVAGDQQRQGQRAELVRDKLLQKGNERLERIRGEQTVPDAAGNLVRVSGTQGQAVTGADGKPVRVQTTTKQDDAVLRARIAQLNSTDPITDPEGYAVANQNLEAAVAGYGGGQGGQGGQAPPVPGARLAPDGQWYVQDKDGNFSVVTP